MVNLVNERRIKKLNTIDDQTGEIIYWMSRDHRVEDNWALLYAVERALQSNQKISVLFCLQPTFLEATLRQYDFMLRGLQEIEQRLLHYHIPFVVLLGEPAEAISAYVIKNKVGLVVTDFSPLKIGRKWRQEVANKVVTAVYEVDAHNIVPVWQASSKLEFAARTIRPKITKQLDTFLTEFPNHLLSTIASKLSVTASTTNWNHLRQLLKIDATVAPVSWLQPGPEAAHVQLETFINHRLAGYDHYRNNPNQSGQSNLSPYLHFGHIAAQRVALEVEKISQQSDYLNDSEFQKNKAVFLEELIIRKELSDNFCYYNPFYDQVQGFPNWAQKTLNDHRHDPREFMYSAEEFEQALTHDVLWNAAQQQMVKTGKMHGYMRMYWAKKILEWTTSPEEALKIAIYLNDRYQLDGRDPNGYVGVAWSIGGVHDRPWFSRPIFGSIRYMSAQGIKKKWNTEQYIILNNVST
jgi:deoxyribodipyrimidine photo-lyase